jgi:malate dehydrogenase
LKACPLVDELALYDVVNTPGVATDLSHISSVAVCDNFLDPSAQVTQILGADSHLQKISGYLPKDDGLKNALTGTDVVVIPAGIPRSYSDSPEIKNQLLLFF